ncbi:hypothetical protein CDL12_02067 [Handroanthus impetiginosus]|uniref:Uncharacterized protein n=1 Tax=Handroanthus impetiginosus TaxID=429701 RepID=A0A2G9I605_9LAMI|nr:hypothetical protein CDL12_02067 [Handroanthus impetiginosus]
MGLICGMPIDPTYIRFGTASRIVQMWDPFWRELKNKKVDIWKSLPDRPAEMPQHSTPKPANKSSPMPRRSPPLPPSSEAPRNVHQPQIHAKDSEARPKYDEDVTDHKSSGNEKIMTPQIERSFEPPLVQKNSQVRSLNGSADSATKNLNLFPVQNDPYNAFVAEFNTNKQSPSNNCQNPDKVGMLEAEVEKLKEQLAQRQEIQDLKQALAARTPSPSRDSSRNIASSRGSHPSATPLNNQAASLTSDANTWGFETDCFKVVPPASSQINVPVGESNKSQRSGESKSTGRNSASPSLKKK